jgi:hypothetical protein
MKRTGQLQDPTKRWTNCLKNSKAASAKLKKRKSSNKKCRGRKPLQDKEICCKQIENMHMHILDFFFQIDHNGLSKLATKKS